MTTVFASPRDLLNRAGLVLGVSDWLRVEQDRIDAFAELTLDRQWIHVDVERARVGSFGATIAHGYLTLSLLPFLLPQVVRLDGASMGVNVGLDRLRFPNVVRAGDRIRAQAELMSAEEIKGGVQILMHVIVEIEGEEKPACVADLVTRYLLSRYHRRAWSLEHDDPSLSRHLPQSVRPDRDVRSRTLGGAHGPAPSGCRRALQAIPDELFTPISRIPTVQGMAHP